jgi:hypothetical protein
VQRFGALASELWQQSAHLPSCVGSWRKGRHYCHSDLCREAKQSAPGS